MSIPVPLQGSVLAISLRPTGVGSYRKVLCQSDFSLDNSVPVNQNATLCGNIPGVGIGGFSGSFNAVFDSNTDPSIEVSLNQLQGWVNPTPTVLDLQIEYPTASSAGSTYLRQGQIYLTKITETASASDLLKFAVTFEGIGFLTTTGS